MKPRERRGLVLAVLVMAAGAVAARADHEHTRSQHGYIIAPTTLVLSGAQRPKEQLAGCLQRQGQNGVVGWVLTVTPNAAWEAYLDDGTGSISFYRTLPDCEGPGEFLEEKRIDRWATGRLPTDALYGIATAEAISCDPPSAAGYFCYPYATPPFRRITYQEEWSTG